MKKTRQMQVEFTSGITMERLIQRSKELGIYQSRGLTDPVHCTSFVSLTDAQIGRLYWYYCGIDSSPYPQWTIHHDHAISDAMDDLRTIGESRGMDSFDAYCPNLDWL